MILFWVPGVSHTRSKFTFSLNLSICLSIYLSVCSVYFLNLVWVFFSNDQKFRNVSPQSFQWIENHSQTVRNKRSSQSQWDGVGGSHSSQDTRLVSGMWPSDLSPEMGGAFPAGRSVVRLWLQGGRGFPSGPWLKGPLICHGQERGWGDEEWQPGQTPTALQPLAEHSWLTFRQLPPLQALFFWEVPKPALPCAIRSITSEMV